MPEIKSSTDQNELMFRYKSDASPAFDNHILPCEQTGVANLGPAHVQDGLPGADVGGGLRIAQDLLGRAILPLHPLRPRALFPQPRVLLGRLRLPQGTQNFRLVSSLLCAAAAALLLAVKNSIILIIKYYCSSASSCHKRHDYRNLDNSMAAAGSICHYNGGNAETSSSSTKQKDRF